MAAKPRKAAPKPTKPARKAPVRKAPAKPARKASTPAKAPRKPAPPRAKAKAAKPRSGDGKPGVEQSSPQSQEGLHDPRTPSAEPATELGGWAPIPDPTPALVPPAPVAARPGPPFDPATGAWLPAETVPPTWARQPQAAAAADLQEPAPEAAKKTTGSVVWTVVLGIDLAFLALNFLAQLVVGAILLFAPGSATAEELQDSFGVGSPRALAVQQAITFVLMGVVPFLWVVGTRRVTWEGTKRYLHLHEPGKGILRGIALTPALLVAVMVLVAAYTIVTEGPDGLSLTESEEGQNPAVEAILAQLTWPVAILIALTAGVGEEILFRGVLQRWIGLWGQAVVFGLAHAAGGFVPQILFAAGLGILFGHLIRRGWSLWTLMTAHFLYDLTLLGTALVYG